LPSTLKIVKVYDDILCVCHSKDINIKKNVTKAKYSQDFRYLAKYSDGIYYKYLASIVKNDNLKYSAYFIVRLLRNNINLKSLYLAKYGITIFDKISKTITIFSFCNTLLNINIFRMTYVEYIIIKFYPANKMLANCRQTGSRFDQKMSAG